MSRAHLTRRQFQVLQEFAQVQDENGIAPTLAELGKLLSLNRATIHGHVQALIEKGLLENLLPGASRGLDLTEEGRSLLPESAASIPAASSSTVSSAPLSSQNLRGSGFGFDHATRQSPSHALPLLGKIAAGGPIEALETPKPIDLPDYLRVDEGNYLLEVAGDSMQNAGIHSGDLVMIDRNAIAKRNDIVVAVLQDGPQEECTLKRWHPLNQHRALLLPENPNYEPLEVDQSELELRGVVKAVIRRLS